MPTAPQAALDALNKNPQLADQFREKYGYVPAPQKAIDALREKPELSDQFQEKYGYLPEATWSQTAKAVPSQIVGGAEQAAGGLTQFVGEQITPPDTSGADPMFQYFLGKSNLGKVLNTMRGAGEQVTEVGETLGDIGRARIEEDTPKNQTFWQQAVSTAAQSAGQAVPLTLAAVVTRSPGLVASGFGVQEFGRAYSDARAKGLSEDQAARHATASGILEAGTEFLPAKELFKQGTGPFKRLVNFMAKELPGENIAELGQLVSERIHGLDDEITAQEVIDTVLLTSAATLITGGMQSTVASGVDRLTRDRDMANTINKVTRAPDVDSAIDAAMESVDTALAEDLESELDMQLAGLERAESSSLPELDTAGIDTGLDESLLNDPNRLPELIQDGSTEPDLELREPLSGDPNQLPELIGAEAGMEADLSQAEQALKTQPARKDPTLKAVTQRAKDDVAQFREEQALVDRAQQEVDQFRELTNAPAELIKQGAKVDKRLDPQRQDRGERRRLQMPDEYAEQIHREKVAKHRLTPEQAADFAPNIRKNKLDYYADDELIPTMERAQQLTEETGQESYIVYSDVFNMGGGNEYFAEQGGEPVFDEKFFIPMARKVVENLNTRPKDADVVPIRPGGDELAHVIHNASREEIEQAMEASLADIAKLNKDLGMADIKHGKKPDSPERGVGLYYGIAKIEPGRKPGEILKEASRQVALDKLRRKNVRREQTETTGAVPPEGQAERAGGRIETAVSGIPEAGQAAAQQPGNQGNEGLDEQPQSGNKNLPAGVRVAGRSGVATDEKAGSAADATGQADGRESATGQRKTGGQVDDLRAEPAGAGRTESGVPSNIGTRDSAAGRAAPRGNLESELGRGRGGTAADDLIADLESATEAPDQGVSSFKAPKKPKGPPRRFTAKQASDRGYIENVNEIDEFNNLIKQAHKQGREFDGETLAQLRELTKEKPRERQEAKQTAAQTQAVLTAANEAATSPTNDLPEPTDAQKEAGNFKMGHAKVSGMDVTIEVPKGGKRSGKSKSGKSWSVTMPAHYGYIKRTEGADGEQIDVYVGDQESDTVYVVDQVNAENKQFDEHKALLNFDSEESARSAYEQAFNDGKGGDRIGAITPMTMEEFKAWAKEGDTSKPLRELKKPETVKQESKRQATGDKPLFSKTKKPKNVRLTEIGDFKTGQPVTFEFLHNTQSATKIFGKPKKDDRFFRNYEPSGRYVGELHFKPEGDQFVTGELTFNNPLVIENRNGEWKKDLSDSYNGLTGKRLSKALIADGYDGVVTVDTDKSGKARNTTEILDLTTFDEGKALYSKTKQPTFFSALKRAAENLKQEKGGATQMLAMLKNQPGVKAEELEWTGLEEYLRGRQAENLRVTKQEVVEFLENNGVQVEEVTKGSGAVTEEDLAWRKEGNLYLPAKKYQAVGKIEYLPSNGKYVYQSSGGTRNPVDTLQEAKDSALRTANNIGFDETKFRQHTLPGGENYREVLLTLPSAEASRADSRMNEIERELQRTELSDEQRNALRAEYRDLSEKSNPDREKNVFRSTHFDEPNILAHIRLNDRTDADGNKVLFVEEIQSDWHQEGRKKGYRIEPSDTLPEGFKVVDFGRGGFGVEDSAGNSIIPGANTKELAIKEFYRHRNSGATPNAPFKGNAWAELAIKRVLRMAAEEGYDSVAWTTGHQQADRYDLSKHLDRIEYEPIDDPANTYELVAFDKSGEEVIREEEIDINRVEELVGKDIAKKIEQREGERVHGDLREWRALSGLDLKVGGEGMIGFYDRTLPNLFKKVAGKLDKSATVGRTQIETGPMAGDAESDLELTENDTVLRPVHSIKITDKMREGAMSGQPLFRKGVQSTTASRVTNKPLGMPVTSVQKIVDEFKASLNLDIEYSVQKTQSEAFGADAREGDKIKGGYYPKTGKIVLVAENLSGRSDILKVLRHETLAHFGLNTLPADTKAEIIEKIIDARDTKSLKRFWDQVDQDYAGESDQTKAEEVFARIAEDPLGKLTRVWTEIKAMIQAALKKLGLIDDKVTAGELRLLVEAIAEGIRRGDQATVVGGQTAFSKSDIDLRGTDATLDRIRPKNAMMFEKPYTGKSGAQLVGYEWKWRAEDIVDSRGEDKTIRVSDWEQSVTNPETNRNIVHQFYVKNTDGKTELVSAETAAKMLGVSVSTARSSAKKLLRNEIEKSARDERAKREAEELVQSEWYDSPAEAIESLTGFLKNVWIKKRDWGKAQDAQYAGRDTVPMIMNSDGKWKFGVQSIESSEALKNAGITEKNVKVSEIWDKDGNPVNPDSPNILFSKTRAPVMSEFTQANRRLREENRDLWTKAKKYYRRQFMPGGLLPKDVFSEKIQRDNEVAVVEFDINHLVGSLENIVKSEYLKPFEKLDRKTLLQFNRALTGNIDPSIKPKTREAIVAMRQYIDSLSQEYANILRQQIDDLGDSPAAEARGQLLETILNNIGTYAHRSYRAFDDKNWFKKIPDRVADDARKYLINQYIEDGETASEAARLAEVTIHEIVKNGTAYGDMETFIRESKLGAKDLSVLKKRKQIAPEIRALMGEYIDPRVNFAKSATKMGRLVWNQRFLDRVQEMGMGTFLFEGKNRPPEATVQIAAEGSEVYAPLNGLWTFPEIDQAFKDSLAKEQMADWYRFIVQMNGLVKYGKTVLSPTTAARNWQSAMFFALANGHFNMKHAATSIAGLREYFTSRGEGARLDYLRKLKKLGVVYDTPYAGEMMRLLEESKIDEIMQSKGAFPYKAFKNLNKFATRIYAYGDDFWKVIGFENEKRSLMNAGLSEAEAEKEAAERIRNTYPTYSMVGKAMNWLRRFPLAGTFVSFPAEIIRTTGNMMRYAYQDIRSDNPKRRALGMKRIAGLSFVASFAWAVQAITKAMFGVDDEEEEGVRLLAAPWERNSNLLFIGRDENGQLQYIDLSFLDPYNYWKRPVTAITRGQPWEDAAADVFKEALSPFLGTDIAAGSIFEVLANKKQGTGAPVYNEFATPFEQTMEIADHLRKALQPGIAANLERTWKALEGERSPSGRKYDLGDEAFGWVGWRFRTLEPKTSLYYSSFEFKDAKAAATNSLSRVLRGANDVTDKDIDSAYESARRQQRDAFREMSLIVNAARQNGMTDQEIIGVLKSSKVSAADIRYLLKGGIPPLTVSDQSRLGAIKKARTVYGQDTAQEINRRYQYARKLAIQDK